MTADATFSACGNYRYALDRIWDRDKPYALFIALNPSTATADQDDATTRKCINYVKAWKEFGGLRLVNLFAYKATLPTEMKAAADPIGRANDRWIKRSAAQAGLIIAAWGNHGAHLGRADAVKGMLPEIHCLRVNASGEPSHPLYLPGELRPFKWTD